MYTRLINFLKRQDLSEIERRSLLPVLRALLNITLTVGVLALVISFAGGYGLQYLLPLGSFILIAGLCYILFNRGMIFPAQLLIPITLLIILTYIVVVGYGLHDINIIGYGLLVILASLTLGDRASFIFAFLVVLSLFGVGFAEMNGLIVSPTSELTEVISPFTISLIVIAITLAQRTLSNLARENIRAAQENEQKQIQANEELRKLQTELEQRVEERTKELVSQQEQAERRSRQFEGVTLVSKAVSTTRNLQQILPQITKVISEQFGFYHVGVFLVDSHKRFAVLSAANSPGGQVMLARGHQLKVGEQGIVGYVTGTGNPRVVLDVGSDSVYFNNPDMPLTHSEMALPLKSSGEIIGALDIQSTERNAFTHDDVEALTALADQVSLTIENARLFDQREKLLTEAEAIQRQYQQETWNRLKKEKKISGFKYNITGAQPLEENEEEPDIKKTGKHEMSVPITLRGENIGTLVVQVPNNEKIGSDQSDLIRAVAERLGLAVENARLFDETSTRASRERLVSDITTKIRSTNDPQEMINTAMRELQQALGATKVEILPQKISPPPDR